MAKQNRCKHSLILATPSVFWRCHNEWNLGQIPEAHDMTQNTQLQQKHLSRSSLFALAKVASKVYMLYIYIT
jgi:hypothetical protein